MILGAIPYGTEIYLEDRTLKKVEQLSINDKILSLKIINENNSSFEFYSKYINQGSLIEKSNIEFSSGTIGSITVKKHSYFKNNNGDYVFYNSIFPYRTALINFSNTSCSIDWLDDSKNLVIDKDNRILSIPSMPEDYIDNILGSNYVYDISKEMSKNIVTNNLRFGDGPFFSVSLIDNFFIFTKNFITLGLVPENLGYRIK